MACAAVNNVFPFSLFATSVQRCVFNDKRRGSVYIDLHGGVLTVATSRHWLAPVLWRIPAIYIIAWRMPVLFAARYHRHRGRGVTAGDSQINAQPLFTAILPTIMFCARQTRLCRRRDHQQ